MAISLDDIQKAAKVYFEKFDSYTKQYDLTKLQPATIGWKVTNIDEYCDTLSGFLKENLVVQTHIGFVDKRYIAAIVFKKPIYQDIRILKLMQRRPGSTDRIGLDHADFYIDDLSKFEAELNKIKLPKWSYESNEMHRWISLWFKDTEAKFVDHLVLDVGVKELQDATKQIGFQPQKLKDLNK